MNNLRLSWEKQRLVHTSYYFNPLNDCNIFANLAKWVKLKRYFFRIDGIIYDLLADPKMKRRSNGDILNGAKRAQGVIFQSEFSKHLFEEILGYKPSKQVIIHNGTNLDLFKKTDGSIIRSKLNIPKDAFVFVTSAKWRVHKRLDAIVESFNQFRRRHSEVSTYLIVIGEHDDMKVDNVFFVQRIDNAELPVYYGAANVYLFYSWLDNCPNSVVEAISCGLPTICTNQGGTRELVEMSHGGIVVDADVPFQFKEVELYKPPRPDMEKISEALDEIYERYEYYCNRIDRNVFDIDTVTKMYLEFIEVNL